MCSKGKPKKPARHAIGSPHTTTRPGNNRHLPALGIRRQAGIGRQEGLWDKAGKAQGGREAPLNPTPHQPGAEKGTGAGSSLPA